MADEKSDRIVPPLHPSRRFLAEHRRNVWAIDVDIGVKPEDLLSLSYWSHFSYELKQGDRIEASAEDGSWFAEFLVRDSGTNWAKVAMLRKHDLGAFSPEKQGVLLPGHSVSYGGTHVLWRVIRDVDKKVLRDKLKTEGDAYGWLATYAKQVAA